MPTIVVTTAADTIAADGKTSLREAIAQASGMSGHVDIVFDLATFWTGSVVTLSLQNPLAITKGNISIDGSLLYGGTSSSVKISAAALNTTAITVEGNATVTLRDLRLEGTVSTVLKEKNGLDGSQGVNGQNGAGYPPNQIAYYGDGTSGEHGTDGQAAPNNAGAGHDAVGAIVNHGTLTLERVDIYNFRVQAGNGGIGGDGGHGGNGGNGERGSYDESHKSGGNGGNGGQSGDGARGGDGGNAVAGIFNYGALTLRDTSFSALSAQAGNGGQGGDGGGGGVGGSYGSSDWDTVAMGGNGADGSDGGNGGNGGAAAAAIYNLGTIKFDGVQSGVSGTNLQAGFGGTAGFYGTGGPGGKQYNTSWDSARDGLDGVDGLRGSNGANGGKGDFLGAAVATGASFTIDSPRLVISEGDNQMARIAWFGARLLGGASTGLKTVDWTITGGKGFSAADFETVGGHSAALSGQFSFNASTTGTGFGYIIADDGKAEGIESFTMTLSNPQGGALGWSKSVTVYITDGDVDGEAPTGIKLSDTSLKENSRNKTTLGTLSTKDGDKGDQFTYELLKDAGGRYKLVGNKIKVADATLLDYEQGSSHKIVVRSTDLFGNSIDKKFKITLENVDPEKLKGNAHDNKLYGGAGKDTINGGLGNDTLKGNGDADRFVFDTKLDAVANVDHIVDFKHDLDKIVLDKDIFKKLSGNTLPDDAFHGKAAAHDNSDRILYQKKTGMLFYDLDGKKDGHDPILFAVLDNHAKIDAGDFVIV